MIWLWRAARAPSIVAMPRRVLAAAAVFAQLGRLHAQGSCPETCLFDGPMTSGDWVELEGSCDSLGQTATETFNSVLSCSYLEYHSGNS